MGSYFGDSTHLVLIHIVSAAASWTPFNQPTCNSFVPCPKEHEEGLVRTAACPQGKATSGTSNTAVLPPTHRGSPEAA